MIESICAAMIAVLIGTIGYAFYEAHQHRVFLEQHGCQLVMKAATGRTRLVGGKLREDEYVYVYECEDGDRTEIGT